MATIDHVVVLMLENRSFDHMLGFLDHPDEEFDGLGGGRRYENPGWGSRASVPATPLAKRVLPFSPDHSHDAVMEQLAVRGRGQARQATNQGFVRSYERLGQGLSPPTFDGLLAPLVRWWTRRSRKAPVSGRGPLVMLCQPPENVPVLSTLALEFGVCTRWFCSVPGETWPNRNFLHAATSDGEVDIDLRPYSDVTIFEQLERYGRDGHARTWHIYHDDTPQVWAYKNLWDTPERHANWFRFSEFASHVAEGRLPAYSFIEPNHRPPVHVVDTTPVVDRRDVADSQHPGNNAVRDEVYDHYDTDRVRESDFARGEVLVARIYEALRGNPDLFERTLLLITYDEHGGLYDHVPPPRGVPAPGDRPALSRWWWHLLLHRKAKSFDFTMLGPRVPAVVVSPYVARGTVDRTVRDHASVPATLRALFTTPGTPPLTQRDAWSPTFHGLLSLDEPRRDVPDLSAYTRLPVMRPAEVTTVARTPAEVTSAVPSHYEDFAEVAHQVLEELRGVSEPEAAQPVAPGGIPRSAHITDLFAEAARRHRIETGRKP